jgi:superfamily II helicase
MPYLLGRRKIMPKYILKGTLGAGSMPVPLEEEISAETDEAALQIAQEKADEMHQFEGYTVVLHVSNELGKEIGTVGAPKAGTPRMCEECRKQNRLTPARYREVYNDLTGTDTCAEHLLSEEVRSRWAHEGTLKRIYDYQLKKEVDRVTLKPY